VHVERLLFRPKSRRSPAFSLQKAISTTVRNYKRDYWDRHGLYTTKPQGYGKHDDNLKKNTCAGFVCMAIDMGNRDRFHHRFFHNEISDRGAVCWCRISPWLPEGRQETIWPTDKQSNEPIFVEPHLRIGIDSSLCQPSFNQGF